MTTDAKMDLAFLREEAVAAKLRLQKLPIWEQDAIRCVSRAAASPEALEILDSKNQTETKTNSWFVHNCWITTTWFFKTEQDARACFNAEIKRYEEDFDSDGIMLGVATFIEGTFVK